MGSTDVIAGSAGAHSDPSSDGWSRFAPSIRGEGTTARRAWQSQYVRRTVLIDVLAAAAASVLSFWLWFGWGHPNDVSPPAWNVVLLPTLWLPAMGIARTYEKRFLWIGVEEYRRVLAAAVVLLAGVGFAAWAVDLRLAPGVHRPGRCPLPRRRVVHNTP